MKSGNGTYIDQAGKVTTFAVVWIEIHPRNNRLVASAVTTFAVVWIEITVTDITNVPDTVTTFAVVWIEIMYHAAVEYIKMVTTFAVVWTEIISSLLYIIAGQSHHLRGGVIEIQSIQSEKLLL